MPISAADAAGALEVARVHELAAAPLHELMAEAARLRDLGHGRNVSYSRKVFIPLTRLCRDTCRYCTFVKGPRAVPSAYLAPDEVLAIARAGAAAGCQEALFTLGDKPELKYASARTALEGLGHTTTLEYLAAMCALVLRETGLLPHINAGVMTDADIAALRPVSVSQGLMLESVSERLCAPGGPHHGSPDKVPAVRLATIEAAGRLNVPFTTGLLIGIGETRQERIEFARRDPGAAPPPWARAGDHHPAVPRQGIDRHGAHARARSRRDAVDGRAGARDVRAGDEHPGTAQPQSRRAR